MLGPDGHHHYQGIFLCSRFMFLSSFTFLFIFFLVWQHPSSCWGNNVIKVSWGAMGDVLDMHGWMVCVMWHPGLTSRILHWSQMVSQIVHFNCLWFGVWWLVSVFVFCFFSFYSSPKSFYLWTLLYQSILHTSFEQYQYNIRTVPDVWCKKYIWNVFTKLYI